MSNTNLRRKIAEAINTESAEGGSDTPDLILARYLTSCLEAFDDAVNQRERFYDRPTPEGVKVPEPD